MKEKTSNEFQSAVDAAWRLVETCGLKKSAFNGASLRCIKDALWLIAQGVPVKQVITTMNEEAYAGEKQLRTLRQRKEREIRDRVERAHKNIKPERALAAADVAAVLARLDLHALLAELHAFLLTETSEEKVKLVFLEILRLHLALKRGRHPRVKRLALALLSQEELEAAYFDSCQTAQMIRELVGAETLTAWINGPQ